jgi:hypothetical protein
VSLCCFFCQGRGFEVVGVLMWELSKGLKEVAWRGGSRSKNELPRLISRCGVEGRGRV